MLAPPSPLQRSKELLLGRDLLRFGLRLPQLRSLPRGDGAAVILIPGFGARDTSFIPLRGVLEFLGHDVRAAGLGRVGDEVLAQSQRVSDLASKVADTTGRSVSLVGWSIGGVVAREVARDRPELIHRVVTLGSPVVGGPSYTSLAGRYEATQLAGIRAEIEDRERSPIGVPITAVWSPNDGVVTPQACIDYRSANVHHVKVSSTHIGLGFDPEVMAIVARSLVGVKTGSNVTA